MAVLNLISLHKNREQSTCSNRSHFCLSQRGPTSSDFIMGLGPSVEDLQFIECIERFVSTWAVEKPFSDVVFVKRQCHHNKRLWVSEGL